MKKFWRFIGKIFLLINKNKKKMFTSKAKKAEKKMFIPLLFFIAFLIIITQLIFVSIIYSNQQKLREELNFYQQSSARNINRVYSQVYLLNARVNQVLEQNK